MSSTLSGGDLARLVELTEAAACADMFRAAPGSLDMHVEEARTHTAFFAPKVDVLLFNRVMNVGVSAPASPDLLADLVARYRGSGVRNFGVQLSPLAETAEPARWLGIRGLSVRDYWTKVYRSSAGDVTVPTDLRVDPIEAAEAQRFGTVACTGFGMPPALSSVLAGTVGRPGWHHYLAWDGDIPAAAAALFVRDRVGWLGIAATLPEYRRRGAQGALMARRIRDAATAGCRWVVTETGQDRPDKPNPSFHNMVRTGFEVAYERPNYMPLGQEQRDEARVQGRARGEGPEGPLVSRR